MISFQLRIPPDHTFLEDAAYGCIRIHWFLFWALLLSHPPSHPTFLAQRRKKWEEKYFSLSSNAKCIFCPRANKVYKVSMKYYTQGRSINACYEKGYKPCKISKGSFTGRKRKKLRLVGWGYDLKKRKSQTLYCVCCQFAIVMVL